MVSTEKDIMRLLQCQLVYRMERNWFCCQQETDCQVRARIEGTLNSRRAASPLVRLQSEVWFLPELVARVAAIVGDHRCHARHGIDSKRLWMCSWVTADQATSTRCQLIWCAAGVVIWVNR
ncbi:hypothetical protein TNCV_2176281 [Trichonephila clavipes]|nr:hypothetical protein TNCV_2176281 [Trichonephila clavipes]